ncbi:MAG: folate family ECF transporter S component [Bacillota bacterium]
MRKSTARLTSMALLIGLAIVLTRVASVRIAIGGIEGIRIGFGSLPIIMAGAMFGPGAGAMAGALEDLIGYFINPMGPYMPHFTVAQALSGFIPGLILWFRTTEVPSIMHLMLAVAVGQGIVAVGLRPYFLETLFGIPRAVTIPPRVVSTVADVVIYSTFIQIVMKRLAYGGVLKRLASLRTGSPKS